MRLAFHYPPLYVEYGDDNAPDGTPESARLAGLLFALLGTPGAPRPADRVLAETILLVVADGRVLPPEAWHGHHEAIDRLARAAHQLVYGWEVADDQRARQFHQRGE